MHCIQTLPYGRSGRLAAALLLLCLACREETTGPAPSSDIPAGAPTDAAVPTTEPTDTTTTIDTLNPEAGLLDNRSTRPGVVFGSVSMPNSYLDNVHTGWMTGGPLTPKSILSHLSGARAKGGRVVVKLCKGSDSYVKNSNGTFSLTKWKALVGSYAKVNLQPYINDGTIIGHYLIDEPHRAQRWGGKAISQATLEEMAKYSKQLWPALTTIVRASPSTLAAGSASFKYVDAGWIQYRSTLGDVAQYAASEVAIAKREGLGLVVGLNLLDGGNGSSKIRGFSKGKWAMSANEIRQYGNALLGQSLACGFFNWTHDPGYYGRSDIKAAMADVSAKAKAHAKTSCRQ